MTYEEPPKNPEEETPTTQVEQQRQNVEALGLPPLPVTSPIQCLTIIGQVEGHMVLPPHNKTTKYEHILPMLIAIEENPDIKGFVILLNTVGGDVEAGLAIAETIAGMTKPSVSLVLGGGHSIGVPLAVSSRLSFIVPSATMTIHPIRLNGLVIGASQTYEYLDRMQERIVAFITRHSKISREEVQRMMMSTGTLASDIGTILVGDEAVSCGLIDRVGGLGDALAALKEMLQENQQPCTTQ